MKIYTTAQIIPQALKGEVFECLTKPYVRMRIKTDGEFLVQYCKGHIKERAIEISKFFWDCEWVKVVKVNVNYK